MVRKGHGESFGRCIQWTFNCKKGSYDLKSTLHDRVSGKVLPGAKGGAPRYLTDEEEKELVRWIEGCAEVGYDKSVWEVRAIVGAIVAKKQCVDFAAVSHGWWDRFRARHPQLSLRFKKMLIKPAIKKFTVNPP